MIVGLVPAWQSTNVDLAAGLKAEAGGVIGGRGKSWIRSSLVLVQVSLSFVLLVGTGLLMESMSAMQNASPGFSTGVLVTSIDFRGAGYDQRARQEFPGRVDRSLTVGARRAIGRILAGDAVQLWRLLVGAGCRGRI